MSLSAYAREAYRIGEEFREMLREQDYAPLLAQISKASMRDLLDFQRAESELVEKLATATPAQQKKLLANLPPERRFWAIASAAQMAFEAAAVIDSAEIELRPGGSYRSMIGAVQTVLSAPYLSERYAWPFPTFSPYEEFE